MTGELERDRRAREAEHDRDDRRGTPGRATLTSRLPPTAGSIARAVVEQLQAKGGLDGPDVHAVAAHGMTGAASALPFLDQIQRAFGHHDISGVNAHVGGPAGEAAVAMGASAYASGDAVAFASTPDLHLAAHEAAHVVQQRGGVRLSGGVGRAGDEYEVNADAVADRVVRGESAQDLLDPFSHRGSSGGSAVQRDGDERTSRALQELERMLLARTRPTPTQIVSLMRRHPDEARAILARVRERLGEETAILVELEVAMRAPELVPVLGSPRARGTSPVGVADTGGGLGADPPSRETAESPIDARREGGDVVAEAHPDEHSTVAATVSPGDGNPLRDVRIVVHAETDAPARDDGAEASGEVAAGVDVESGRASGSVSTEVRPAGDRGPTLRGEAAVSAGTDEEGRLDVRGSGRVELSVPLSDRDELHAAGIITEDGHVRVEAGVDLLPRVRALSEDNAARPVLIELFVSVDHTLGGDTEVEGGASLQVQFDRSTSAHDDAGETHRLASAGTSGSGTALPHLERIQAAFGHHDISGVRAHVGGEAAAATGALGARGYAYGDAVAFAASPDLRLAAHEAAHVVQQRGGVRLDGGVGRSGDEYEQHADAVAELVVRGESAQTLLDERAHRGAAGGPAVQRDHEEDRAWLAGLHHDGHGRWTTEGRALSHAELRRLRRVLAWEAEASGRLSPEELTAYRSYVAGAAQPLDAAAWRTGGGAARTAREDMTGAVSAPEREESSHPESTIERTSVDEGRDRVLAETGSSARGTRGRAGDSARGSRRRSTETLDDGTAVHVDAIDETRRQVTDDGAIVERTERGRRATAIGGPTVAAEVRDELVRQREDLADDLASADGEGERARIRERRARLQEDIDALAEPDASAATAAEIARRYRLSGVREEDVTTTTTRTDLNPLDGTVGRATETARDARDMEGGSARVVDHRSVEADLAGGAIEEREAAERTATSAEGSRITDRTSRTDRVEVGDGRAMATRTRREEREDETAGGAETRTATERATSGGVIVSEDETGIRVGRSSRTESETEVDGVRRGSTSESSTAVELTDRRVGASHSREREVRRGTLTGTARGSADGSFSIDVTPMDDGSGRYRLTFTIHIGVDGSLSGSRAPESGSDGARGSLSVRGSAAGDLITTRTISETEAQRYLAAADRADRGEDVSDPPEFSRLSRLRAAGEGADALLQSGAVFGSGDSAAAMSDGDSITLDTEVGIGGDVSAGGTRGGVGIGVEAGGDARWRRTVQVERITVGGQPRVRLTVTYTNETEWHAGGTLSATRVGAARVRHEEEAAATDAVQFVLDPNADNYDERYENIVGTFDRDRLRELEREYRDSVRRSRHAESDAEEDEHEVGPTSDAMIGARERSHRSEDITVVHDEEGRAVGLEGTVEGGNEWDVRARVAGHDVDLGGHTETVRADLDRARGMHVDVEAREESIDPVAAISDAADDFAEADGRERAAMVMARSPSEHVLHALRQFNDRWGYHLDQTDLERLSERAHDSRRWSACCIVADSDVIDAWNRLRGALANPRPRAEEAAVDPVAATHLARARALATWMEAASGHGAECLELVLRRWGETTTHEASDERLGDGYEWPSSLRHEATSYETLVTQAHGMRDRFEGALARPSGKAEARAHYAEVSTGLNDVLHEVRGCEDFRSEARRSELIREIEQQRAEVEVRWRDFLRRWHELHPHEGASDDVATPTAEAIAATRLSAEDRTSARSRAYVQAMVRVLRDNHTHETRLLQAAQRALPDDDTGPLFGNSGRAEAATLCSQVHDLHGTWIQQIEDLRQAYTQAGTPEIEWEVSTGPDGERNRQLEPNIGWLIIEYRRAMRFALDAYAEDRMAQWREQGRY
ncbi:MAG TPA: DUF4157 domain-containing protein [Kofleriaceae bacterium]